ncbi:MAG: hypothetical protein MJ152_00475 [Clostridia bacterium]|nr:hypothetical protein [Clostridia bacterium]
MKNKIIKLAIDVDDCMCNTVEMDYACAYNLNKHNKKLCKDFDKDYFSVARTFELNKQETFNFFMKEKQYIMKNCSMYPKVFVKEVLHLLRKHGIEIIVTSSRDDIFWNGKAEKHLKAWLKKFKIEYDKIYCYGSIKKEEICKQLNVDYLVEDNVESVTKANKNKIKTFLIKATYNASYKHKLNKFAENWLDLYEQICEIYNLKKEIDLFEH